MELSIRLKKIVSMIEKCHCILDVGTDHAYVPIYLVKNGISKTAIASDINRGPVEKAKINVLNNKVDDKVHCRLGSGLSTVKSGEADVAIIAGMGGNLIRDIIEDNIEVFKNLEYAVLQPVQNAEVLREYLYSKGYEILDEEICEDDNKFYEIIKVKYNNSPVKLDSIYYEISKILINKKHPVMKSFIEYKLQKYSQIYGSLNEETYSSKIRKEQLAYSINKLEEFLQCF